MQIEFVFFCASGVEHRGKQFWGKSCNVTKILQNGHYILGAFVKFVWAAIARKLTTGMDGYRATETIVL